MKECPSCKSKNQDAAAFCTECGADLKGVPTQAGEWAAAAGGLLNKAKDAAVAGAGKVQDGPSAPPRDVGSMFVDQSESAVATIGSNYLQNYLSGGGVSKSIGVLTQKRFYFKGRNFSGTGRAMKSRTEEGMVSIGDITFSEFIYTRHIGLLISAIVFVLLALSLFVVVPGHVSWGGNLFIALMAAALVCAVMYFLQRQTLFLICFPGGGFAFDVKYYPIADIRDFQRQLHLLKDHIKENA